MARAHRRVRGGSPHPAPRLSWYPYVDTKSTVRVRGGRIHVRISDHLEDAPDHVLEGLLGILLCRLDRVPEAKAGPALVSAYEAYVHGDKMDTRRGDSRRDRGRKHLDPAGEHRSLLESYLRVMLQMGLRFSSDPDDSLPAPPILSWSKTESRRRFGHYDKDHGCIVISRVLDDPKVPVAVLDYVVYHELLHLLHPVQYGEGGRRGVHSKTFLTDEAKWPDQKECEAWLTRLASRRRTLRRRLTA